ncbi:MAG: DUF2628 domain-containing protein [Rhodospirillales bacterium]|jgi:hypothetical protein|nr:DUF2628 domain-containing protein [Rhodospirillales bacterium]
MRVYSVHFRSGFGGPDFALIKEGFCWPAFLLSALWALWHRMWWVAAGLVVVSVAIGSAGALLGLDPLSDAALSLATALIVGFFANDMRRLVLERRGYSNEGVVLGDNEDGALERFLANSPVMMGVFRA